MIREEHSMKNTNTASNYEYSGLSLMNTRMVDIEDKDVWNKSTVQYVVNNAWEIRGKIIGNARKRGWKTTVEDDILYSEVLQYVIKYDDYSYEKARELARLEGSKTVISLPAYVNSAIRYVVCRYIQERSTEANRVVASSTADNEVDILDLIADSCTDREYEDIECSLEDALKLLEHKRYIYGIDMYVFLYLKIKIRSENLEHVFEVLEINTGSKALSMMARKDADIIYVLSKCISSTREEILKEIRKYIYGADILDRAIEKI
jgi:hypothetical protein